MSRLMKRKPEERVAVSVHLPVEVREYLMECVSRNYSTQTGEIVRSIRERMDRESAQHRSSQGHGGE